MLVESFEALEVLSTHSDEDCTQAIDTLRSELGIKDATQKTETQITFRRATMLEINVYGILMPKCSKLEEYSDGPIPLRILELCKKAKEQGLPQLWVWCPDTGPKDDPIVFSYERSWNPESDSRIIGRWGDCLEHFDVLTAKAIALAKMKMTAALTKINMHSRMSLKMLETNTVNTEELMRQARGNVPDKNWAF